jgi:hypothetical protein
MHTKNEHPYKSVANIMNSTKYYIIPSIIKKALNLTLFLL